ncbi:CMGC/SRPK protein kinase [Helicocarpus griseus UAMH5409]|uniref:CMGC/SRPK protein kinase n=1 Tax=Helicocarpus griseus UAMH5409 TaxID=1447875 RepID=A0A2B7X043_9EURO|nr:CMGC/SRPK protein kinase [Helicocarpus griseus UAMH5409]
MDFSKDPISFSRSVHIAYILKNNIWPATGQWLLKVPSWHPPKDNSVLFQHQVSKKSQLRKISKKRHFQDIIPKNIIRFDSERYSTRDTVLLGSLDMVPLPLPRPPMSLKLYVSGSDRTRELKVYDRINETDQGDHPSKEFIRKLLGFFWVKGPNDRSHLCLVHEPLGPSLAQIQDIIPQGRLPLGLLKPLLRQALIAVDFLHAKAGLIHTDLQVTNFLSSVSNKPEIFTQFKVAEFIQPAPRKILSKDRIIYVTRRTPMSYGFPLLSDFGEARFNNEAGSPGEDIMPIQYKAPEIIMQTKWNYKVDVWNMGMVIWHLVTGRPMFEGRNADGTFQDDRVHLAEMIALMGAPLVDFLQRSTKSTSLLWDNDGTWKNAVPIPTITLEKLSDGIIGEDKEGFLRFIRRMLCWRPEDRPTCEELVFDPWLMEGLGAGTET